MNKIKAREIINSGTRGQILQVLSIMDQLNIATGASERDNEKITLIGEILTEGRRRKLVIENAEDKEETILSLLSGFASP